MFARTQREWEVHVNVMGLKVWIQAQVVPCSELAPLTMLAWGMLQVCRMRVWEMLAESISCAGDTDHTSLIITTLTHTQATSCISVCVYDEQYLNNLRNLCITWRTCHHAVGGLLVAIVTWGHWVVQAGWRIAQSRRGQVHMRAFGWLDQWQTWGE